MTFLEKVSLTLKSAKVPHAIAGGYALVLHGVVRGTVDIDLVTKLTESNLKKIEKALMSIGLQSRIPVTAQDIFNFREEYIKNKNLIAWSFVNPTNPTEVVDILITNDMNEYGTKVISFKNKKIKIIDKKSLIKMKTKAGRPQDLEDIKALEKL